MDLLSRFPASAICRTCHLFRPTRLSARSHVNNDPFPLVFEKSHLTRRYTLLSGSNPGLHIPGSYPNWKMRRTHIRSITRERSVPGAGIFTCNSWSRIIGNMVPSTTWNVTKVNALDSVS